MEKNIFLKRVFIFVLFGILLTASGVFANVNSTLSEGAKQATNAVIQDNNLSQDKIENITQVDFNNLPPQVNLTNIDRTNLAIYKIDYAGGKSVFVLTASDKIFEKATKASSTTSNTLLLNFGLPGKSSNSEFLKTATGVTTGKEKGYVMMRKGSITGISTNMEIVSGSGEIQIIVYRNGESTNFENGFVVNSTGVKKDYDVQSDNVLTFNPGDVISVYISSKGNLSWRDITTLVELKAS